MSHREPKSRRLQTATFKHIACLQSQTSQNQQQKQFAQTLTKQSTIDKVNAIQFQNNTQNCRHLIDSLLKQYDLWHPQTQTTLCESVTDHSHLNDSKDNCIDGIREYNDEDNINQTENSNIKLKSNIIFLELENKKLQLKQKLLEKKYQKESIAVKMAPNMEIILQKKEKELLEIELSLLKEVKALTQHLEEMKELPIQSVCAYSVKTSSCRENIPKAEIPSKQKQKKLNKAKLLKYLIEKADKINSKEQFLQLLSKTQASLKA